MRTLRKCTILMSIALIHSCVSNNKENFNCYNQDFYSEFTHVKQFIDRQTEEDSYYFTKDRLSNEEKDSLIHILKKYKKEYIITSDSSILVKINPNNLQEHMRIYHRLEMELLKMTHSTYTTWEYKTDCN